MFPFSIYFIHANNIYHYQTLPLPNQTQKANEGRCKHTTAPVSTQPPTCTRIEPATHHIDPPAPCFHPPAPPETHVRAIICAFPRYFHFLLETCVRAIVHAFCLFFFFSGLINTCTSIVHVFLMSFFIPSTTHVREIIHTFLIFIFSCIYRTQCV